MALNLGSLTTALTAILDTSSTPVDHPDFSKQVADAVDAYLLGAEMDPFPAAGKTTSTPPVEDTVGPSALSIPDPLIVATTFRTKFAEDVKSTHDGAPRDFSLSSAAFKSDIATVVKNKDAAGYEGTGATVVAVTPDIDAAFDIGQNGGSHTEVATKLAAELHACVTSAAFTLAAYAKAEGGFVGVPAGPLKIK